MATQEGAVRTFDLSLVTPEGAAYEGEAEMLIVPGVAGEIGVLARHAPLVAMLQAGEIRVKAANQWQSFAAGPGYFKVQQDRALVLVDDAVERRRSTSRRPAARPTRRAPFSTGSTPARRRTTAGRPSSACDTPRTSSPSPAGLAEARRGRLAHRASNSRYLPQTRR